jgi:hypothetical protein
MMGPGRMQDAMQNMEEVNRQARLNVDEVLIMRGGQREKMEPTTGKIVASMGQGFKNVLLFNPTRKVAIVVPGQRSPFLVTENPPVFLVRQNPINVFGIGKFTIDKERDIRYMNSYSRMGVSAWETEPENAVKFTVSRETEGSYPRFQMVPATPLAPGEYLIYKVDGSETIYEFTVER